MANLIRVSYQLGSFAVPVQVEATRGKERIYLQLEDLDPETLDTLCDEFRDAVFKAAKKEQPARPLP